MDTDFLKRTYPEDIQLIGFMAKKAMDSTVLAGELVYSDNSPVTATNGFNFIFTLTHSFKAVFGFDKVVTVFESGVTYISGLDEALLYTGNDAQGRVLEGASGLVTAGKEFVAGSESEYLDSLGSGYRMAVEGTYFGFLDQYTLNSKFYFSHDVDGNSAGVGGRYTQHVKNAVVSIEVKSKGGYLLRLKYSAFWGMEDIYNLSDRDNIQLYGVYTF